MNRICASFEQPCDEVIRSVIRLPQSGSFQKSDEIAVLGILAASLST